MLVLKVLLLWITYINLEMQEFAHDDLRYITYIEANFDDEKCDKNSNPNLNITVISLVKLLVQRWLVTKWQYFL